MRISLLMTGALAIAALFVVADSGYEDLLDRVQKSAKAAPAADLKTYAEWLKGWPAFAGQYIPDLDYASLSPSSNETARSVVSEAMSNVRQAAQDACLKQAPHRNCEWMRAGLR